MDPVVQRLEGLLSERSALVDRYAELWALYGGASHSWALRLLEIECAPLKSGIRTKLSLAQRTVKESDVEDCLLSETQYTDGLRSVFAGRVEWARVKEQMATLNTQIQVELAKLRLNLGEDAMPADQDLADDPDV